LPPNRHNFAASAQARYYFQYIFLQKKIGKFFCELLKNVFYIDALAIKRVEEKRVWPGRINKLNFAKNISFFRNNRL
tara:strand:+ start:319 stop:549 length:231 start_codon:yes stop_codon:yes gene_type:complete